MIFFFNSQGDLIKSVPETVKQGSNKASRIWFLMPTASSNTVDLVARLPNGKISTKHPMTFENEVINGAKKFVDEFGETVNAWYYDLEKDITSYAGQGGLTFTIYTGEEELKTIEVGYTVLSGAIENKLPTVPDAYVELQNFIAAAQQRINNNTGAIESLDAEVENLKQEFDAYVEQIPEIEHIGGNNEDFNKLYNATIVTTYEELIASTTDAVCAGIRLKKNTAYEVDSQYSILKLVCNEGDIIHSKLAPHWYHGSTTPTALFCIFYDNAGSKIQTMDITFANAADFISNGITAPTGTAYVLVSIYARYYTDVAETYALVADNGLKADVITLNADASYTTYDRSGELPDYTPTIEDEEYFKFVDDVRIQRYEEKIEGIKTNIGNIEKVLSEVVGGV